MLACSGGSALTSIEPQAEIRPLKSPAPPIEGSRFTPSNGLAESSPIKGQDQDRTGDDAGRGKLQNGGEKKHHAV